MLNSELLKYVIAREHHTQDEVAEALGYSRQSLQNRLNGSISFNLDELDRIRVYLKLTDAEVNDIFLN